MKVLVCIAHYEADRDRYLEKVLKAYEAFDSRYEITVYLYATEPFEWRQTHLKLCTQTYPPEIGKKLLWEHRQDMIYRQDDFDLFILSENDVLITQKNVDTLLACTEDLHESMIVGFLRYEKNPSDPHDPRTYLTDLFGGARMVIFAEHEGTVYAIPSNPHQASFCFTRAQLKRIIAAGAFSVEPFTGPFELLEMASSEPFFNGGMRKVLPLDHLKDLLIEHLPGNYFNRQGHDPLPLEDLYVQREKCAKAYLPYIPRLSWEQNGPVGSSIITIHPDAEHEETENE